MAHRRFRQPVILVHGGCGMRPPTVRQTAILRQAIQAGYALLERGAPALDAVEAAVVFLERSGEFNAGKGAKRQQDGVARLDASIMDGRDLSAGAVAGLEGILTPVRVARLVMEQTPHVLLIGRHAERLARRFKIETYRFPPATRSKPPKQAPKADGHVRHRRCCRIRSIWPRCRSHLHRRDRLDVAGPGGGFAAHRRRHLCR